MKKKITLFVTTSLFLLLVTTIAFAGARFIGNKKSKLLHDSQHSACQNYVKKMAKKNKVNFKSAAQAKKAGYNFCKKC